MPYDMTAAETTARVALRLTGGEAARSTKDGPKMLGADLKVLMKSCGLAFLDSFHPHPVKLFRFDSHATHDSFIQDRGSAEALMSQQASK